MPDQYFSCLNRKRVNRMLALERRTCLVFYISAMILFGLYCKTVKAGEDICVDVYNPEKAYNGTTLLPDNHVPASPRVIEVDMEGNIIWSYVLPESLRRYTNPGFDVEYIPGGSILLVLPGKGVYEVDRGGGIVWSYSDSKVSHDADRLSNGNTIVVFGNNDRAEDAQVKEVDSGGKIIWRWYAKDHYNKEPYKDINDQGWTHANAVSRLPNGNTLISLRNFHFVVEVNSEGRVLREIGKGVLRHQHDPAVLSNGNILIANHMRPQAALEIDPASGDVVWQFGIPDKDSWPVRDADRLPNGNTLITGTTKIVEVTPYGEVVWLLKLKDVTFKGREGPARGFYKATRIKR